MLELAASFPYEQTIHSGVARETVKQCALLSLAAERGERQFHTEDFH